MLRRVYRFSSSDCIGAIEALLASSSVRAGLQLLAATNWRPLTRRQRGFWLQPVSRCVCFFELIRRTSP
ncbi:hypothetical protein [Cyanobium sp. Tous-M-B4]|uniref:hypothetical protein n=1 Tax=Cyanobium sp. Tous-M-B4 TaxID=2823724 RepID=UPI0020CF7729|nr:hypothetical protein [Cyanobium sp. Tous-M-B4]MCP9776980.1 hypothetical protein [Cyanobium sp. Tous-M-B4]MCP9875246.1 hypothetical protein [Cyanobium sp. A2C-AMD]